MLKKIALLPGMIALTLFVSGCEEGDFDGDVGEPDIQTEQPLETDADLEATDETGFGEEETFEEGDPGIFEESPEAALEESPQSGVGDDATTADPVPVEQDVQSPDSESQSGESQSGSQSEDADAVEEVPAESLPGDQQGGNQ